MPGNVEIFVFSYRFGRVSDLSNVNFPPAGFKIMKIVWYSCDTNLTITTLLPEMQKNSNSHLQIDYNNFIYNKFAWKSRTQN